MGGVTKTSWSRGQSGNPAGRPPKNRALTAILERAGNKGIDGLDGKRITRKRLLADMLWQLATTGEAVFPNNQKLQIAAREWIDIVKLIYGQIDGPPKQTFEVNIKREAEKIAAEFGLDPAEVMAEAELILAGVE
jgi:hypothetical protein